MTKTVSILVILGMLGLIVLQGTAEAASTVAVPRMTKEQVKSMMGNPGFIVVDVRAPKDWDSSVSRIKGAMREDPSNIPAWADKYPKEKTLLFYCA